MADHRRRRRAKSEVDSEEVSCSESLSSSERETEEEERTEITQASDPAPNEVVQKECEHDKIIESEYESAEDEKAAESKEGLEDINGLTTTEYQSELVDEEGGQEGIAEGELLDVPLSDESESINEERQQGDGEEGSTAKSFQEKVLDYDEDRRNPQYIPKNGTFYEHDDRISDLVEEKDRDKKKKKKQLWQDSEKWGHDRYHEEEQTPKSRDEIISEYGYDIRVEHNPPRSRHPRRYGRGPVKYNRNWEDEDAYSKNRPPAFRKNSAGRRPKGGGRGYYNKNRILLDEEPSVTNSAPGACYPNRRNKIDNSSGQIIVNDSEFPSLPRMGAKIVHKSFKGNRDRGQFSDNATNRNAINYEHNSSPVVKSQTYENSVHSQSKMNNGDNENNRKDFEHEKSQPRESNGELNHGRFQRSNRGYKSRNSRSATSTLITEMENMSLKSNETEIKTQLEENKRIRSNECSTQQDEDAQQENISPRGVDISSGRPKRYSSLRQRSLPESPSFQGVEVPTPPVYYDAGYEAAMYEASEMSTPVTQPQDTAEVQQLMPQKTYSDVRFQHDCVVADTEDLSRKCNVIL